MNHDDFFRIKQFIRVSQELETLLGVTSLQKKILLALLDLWNKENHLISVGTLASSVQNVSERSVYRHLEALVHLNWIKMTRDKHDGRIKLVTPTPRLLKVLSTELQ